MSSYERPPQGITNKLDARMMEAVRQAVETADAVLVVVDCAVDPESVLPIVQSAPASAPSIAVVRLLSLRSYSPWKHADRCADGDLPSYTACITEKSRPYMLPAGSQQG